MVLNLQIKNTLHAKPMNSELFECHYLTDITNEKFIFY